MLRTLRTNEFNPSHVRSLGQLSLAALVVGALLTVGCKSDPRDIADQPVRLQTLTPNAYFTEGTDAFLAADMRSAKLAAKSKSLDVLPIQFVVVNKRANTTFTIERESLILEGADGRQVPLMSQKEFEDDYDRARQDARIGENFLQHLTSRFSEPPYDWKPMQFFAIKQSPVVAREKIEVQGGELVHGYIFFPIDEIDPKTKRKDYTLLITPKWDGEDATPTTYVLPIRG